MDTQRRTHALLVRLWLMSPNRRWSSQQPGFSSVIHRNGWVNFPWDRGKSQQFVSQDSTTGRYWQRFFHWLSSPWSEGSLPTVSARSRHTARHKPLADPATLPGQMLLIFRWSASSTVDHVYLGDFVTNSGLHHPVSTIYQRRLYWRRTGRKKDKLPNQKLKLTKPENRIEWNTIEQNRTW